MSKIVTGFPGGLKRARIKAGYKTQQEFADAFHKSLNAVQKWEQGKTKPSMDEFLDLCRFFDCNADYLLYNIDEKTHDLQFICDTTGLSSQAINILMELNQKSAIRAYTDMLSCVIEDPDFEYFLGLLEGYFSNEICSAELSMSRFDYRKKDLSIFAAGNALQNIMERVKPLFLSQYLTTDERLDEYTESLLSSKQRRKNNG